MQEDLATTPQTWLITGANGHLGQRLIGELLRTPDHHVTAVVRSERARAALQALPTTPQQQAQLQIRVLSYTDTEALRAAAAGCDRCVHLVGILKEGKGSSYHEAHEASTAALLAALAGSAVAHLTYLSIVGSSTDAHNACLASKGRAEALCEAAAIPACILRVPMVLGEGDYASRALAHRAAQAVSLSFRADSLEQPIYAGDVVAAIRAAAQHEVAATLDLGGPEVLTRRALTQRAARQLGRSTRLLSLPLGVGMLLADLLTRSMAYPPFTRPMLEVLDHDDEVDPAAALHALQLPALTPLDTLLAAVLSDFRSA